MPEEVSPESKLYVKEEIEKTRKEIKEEVEKVSSKATKTFTTVAIVIGLITGLGVYGSAKHYINTAVEANLGTDTLAEIQNNRDKARNSYKQIVEYEKDAEKILSGRPIIGTIAPYGGEIVETTPGDPYQVQLGWFFCNGASLDREEYKDLFDVIGVAFGAPDPNTFNLPDLRGRFVRGVDDRAGNDPDARLRKAGNKGGNTGNKVGSYQLDNIQTHSHQWGVRVSNNLYSWNKESKHVMALDRQAHNQIPGGSGKDDDYMDVAAGSFWTELVPSVVNPKTETRPKNVYVNWIIRAR
jgi:microcystin-dependent protein